jgi:hypothetical protein
MRASIRQRRIGAADPNISMLVCITSSITLCTRSPSVQESSVVTAPSNRSRSAAHPLVRLLRALLGVAALSLGLLELASANTRPASRAAASLRAQPPCRTRDPSRAGIVVRCGLSDNNLSQADDDTSSGKGASPDQIEKYVAVYRAMQRNHNLTIEQAAAAQGLTVAAFRELEQRIESDELARDDARRALAEPEPSEAATTAPARKAPP